MDGHDRYHIYRLLGHEVEVSLPTRFGHRKLSGVVERVCRNIFDGLVEVTLNGSIHTFREPRAILCDGSEVVFIYGGGGLTEDDEIFEEHSRTAISGETIYDVMRRTKPQPEDSATFRLGRKVRRRRRTWRARQTVPA
jgi:hypothetical protein